MLAVLHTCIYDAWGGLREDRRRDADRRLPAPAPPGRADGREQDAGRELRGVPRPAGTLPGRPAGGHVRRDDGPARPRRRGHLDRHHDGDRDRQPGLGRRVGLPARRRQQPGGDLHPGPYSDYTGYAPVNTPDTVTDVGRWQPLRIQARQRPADRPEVHRAALGPRDAVRAHGRRVPGYGAARGARHARVHEAGEGGAQVQRRPHRPREGRRRVLGRWAGLRAAAGALVPVRAARLQARRPLARPRRADVLRDDERDPRREHRVLGREAALRLRAPGDRDPASCSAASG